MKRSRVLPPTYLFCALVAVGLLALHQPHTALLRSSGWLFVLGLVLFSGSLYVMAITGIRGLGAITPFGGPMQFDVDLTDFSMFSVCFGLTGPTAECPPDEFDCADMNDDDWVNLTDFNTFQVLFGNVSTNSPPNCP